MITSANYTIDGKVNNLNKGEGDTWSDINKAPNESGLYPIGISVSNEVGQTAYIDNTSSKFNLNLRVSEDVRNDISLIEYLPEYLQDIKEFKLIMEAESQKFNELYFTKDKTLDMQFVDYMDIEAITRYENFLGIVGEGTLEQRRSYIRALYSKGDKLSENSIKAVVKSITGGKALIKFFGGDEALNPNPGQGTLRVQVLSPDMNINYKFDDIIRAIAPYMPAHIKLNLIKYFATWGDISEAYTDWQAIKEASSWQELYNYIPPEIQI